MCKYYMVVLSNCFELISYFLTVFLLFLDIPLIYKKIKVLIYIQWVIKWDWEISTKFPTVLAIFFLSIHELIELNKDEMWWKSKVQSWLILFLYKRLTLNDLTVYQQVIISFELQNITIHFIFKVRICQTKKLYETYKICDLISIEILIHERIKLLVGYKEIIS